MRQALSILVLVVCWTDAFAQYTKEPTLLQRIAEARDDVTISHSLTIGLAPPFKTILSKADLVLRGVIDALHSRLTADSRSIVTEYLIQDPQIFITKVRRSNPDPAGPEPITFRMHGGSVAINGHRATVLIDGVAPLMVGMEVIVLLEAVEGRTFVPVGVGLFEVRSSLIVPLVLWEGEHLKFGGVDADTFLNEILNPRTDSR